MILHKYLTYYPFVHVCVSDIHESLCYLIWSLNTSYLAIFRATLNFRKFKVALNPMYIIFFKLCQELHLILLIKIL